MHGKKPRPDEKEGSLDADHGEKNENGTSGNNNNKNSSSNNNGAGDGKLASSSSNDAASGGESMTENERKNERLGSSRDEMNSASEDQTLMSPHHHQYHHHHHRQQPQQPQRTLPPRRDTPMASPPTDHLGVSIGSNHNNDHNNHAHGHLDHVLSPSQDHVAMEMRLSASAASFDDLQVRFAEQNCDVLFVLVLDLISNYHGSTTDVTTSSHIVT